MLTIKPIKKQPKEKLIQSVSKIARHLVQNLKQSKLLPGWVGALQVQIMNSMFYMNLISTGMMIMTFWYTAGYQIQNRYAPWFNLWTFVGMVILIFAIVMVVDYIFILPTRVSFTNEQACKHNNPWMDEILLMKKDLAKIKKALEIED
jgi:hypothetical protein